MQPIPDGRVLPEDGDPAEVAAARETIRLAFVAALQHLPARQRAVLILREVLRWQATEVAELLDTTVASVNSALQRARATLADRDLERRRRPAAVDPAQEALLARYVDAFERYDITSLVALLHDDAVMSMPPYDFWLQGPDEMGKWFLGPGSGCEGSRLVPTTANGCAGLRLLPARTRTGGHAPGRHPGDRDLRRSDRRPPQLPRPGAVRRCSACPSAPDPAGGATAVTTTPHQPSSSSRPTRDASAPCTSMAQPSRRAASWQRARRSASARSGRSAPASGQLVTSRPSAVTTTTVVRPGCCTLVRRRGGGELIGRPSAVVERGARQQIDI